MNKIFSFSPCFVWEQQPLQAFTPASPAHILKLFSMRLNALLGLLRFYILVAFCCVSFGASGQGVTVITHGFQATGNLSNYGFLDDYAKAIIQRAGGRGSVFINDENGRWKAVNGITNTDNPNDEIILLYNWAAVSNKFRSLGNRELESAADQLFAMLLSPPSSLGINKDGLLGKKKHFIAHSRGNVLFLQVFFRLQKYFSNYPVEHFTSLDPHPAQIGFDDDELNGVLPDGLFRSKLWLPSNVEKSDNYYQRDLTYELDFIELESFMDLLKVAIIPESILGDINVGEFDGVNITNSNKNILLHKGQILGADPERFIDDNCSLGWGGGNHSKVHAWYYNTINSNINTPTNEYLECLDPKNWYFGLEKTSIGYNFSRIGGGIDNLPKIRLPSATENEKLKDQIATVYNGDFSFGSIGYDQNGGTNKPDMIKSGFLTLYNYNSKNIVKHSIMYFPYTLEKKYKYLSFNLSQIFPLAGRPKTGNLVIRFFKNGSSTPLKTLYDKPIDNTTQTGFFSCEIPSELLNSSGTFSFSYTGGIPYNNNSIRIDDVTLTETPNEEIPPVCRQLGFTVAQTRGDGLVTINDLYVDAVTQTTAILRTISGYPSYRWRYRKAGTGPWTEATSTSFTTIITGLSPSTNYEFGVSCDCLAFTSFEKTFKTLYGIAANTYALEVSERINIGVPYGTSAATLYVDQTYTYRTKIKNIGSIAYNGALQLQVRSLNPVWQEVLYEVENWQINAGETKDLVFNFTPTSTFIGTGMNLQLAYVVNAEGLSTWVNYGNGTPQIDNPIYNVTIREPLRPDMTPTNGALNVSNVGVGSSLTATWTNQNIGQTAANNYNTIVVLSQDDVYDLNSDIEIARETTTSLGAGSSAAITKNIVIPNTVLPGIYKVLIVADPNETIKELSETNNIAALNLIVESCEQISLTTTPSPTTCNLPNGYVGATAIGSSAFTYLWNTGATSSVLSNLTSGTYSVTATASNGCKVSQSATVTSTGTLTSAKFTYRISGKSIIVTNTSTGATGYTWSFGDNTTSTEVNPTHTFANGGNYLVCLTAKNATCSDVNCTNIAISNNGCEIPIGISSSSITQTSATISWQASASANSYNLRYRSRYDRNIPNSWVTIPNIIGLNYPLSNLYAANTYEIQVQTNCNAGVSDWSETYFFSTINPYTGTSILPYPTFFKQDIENFHKLTQLTDGNYIGASLTGTNFTGRELKYTKLSPTGNVIWSKKFTSYDPNDALRGLEKTSDGGFVALISANYAWDDSWTLFKFDANGNIVWSKSSLRFSIPNWDNERYNAKTVKVGPDGSIYVGGSTYYYDAQFRWSRPYNFVQKFDGNGNLLLNNRYPADDANDQPTDILVFNDNSYVFAFNNNGGGTNAIALVYCNPLGVVQWQNTYYETSPFNANLYLGKYDGKLCTTNQNDIFLAFYTPYIYQNDCPTISYYDVRAGVIKLNKSDGDVITYSAQYSSKGNIAIYPIGNNQVVLNKSYGLSGLHDLSLWWSKKYKDASNQLLNVSHFIPTNDGGYLISGTFGTKPALIKTLNLGGTASCIENADVEHECGFNVRKGIISVPNRGAISSEFKDPNISAITDYSTTSSDYCTQCIIATHIITSKTNICPNENVVFASGGTGGSNYEWKINGVPVSTASSFQYKFPTSGSYTVSVTVSNNASCIATASETVVIGSVPTFAVVNINNESCNSSNGSASVNITEGSSGASIVWSNGKTGISTTGLKAGNHAVIVIGSNGCVAPAQKFDVNNVGTTDFTIRETIYPASCNTNGSISVLVENVVGTPTYRWSNGATTSFVSNLVAGTYTVTVSDGIGCSKSKSIVVTDLCCPLVNGFIYLGKENCNCFYKSTVAVPMSSAGNLPGYTAVTGFSAKVTTIYNAAVNALYTGQGIITIGLRDNVAPTNCEASNSSNPKESNCWVWQDNTSMVYKNWAPIEPNNGGGAGENYGHVYNDGTWNDINAEYVMLYGLQLTPNTGTQLYYADVDGDGYGRPNSQIRACTAPAGYVLNNLDCNDSNALIFPGGTEIVNGLDDDCDGRIDENVTDLCPLLSGFTYLGIENCNCFYKSNAAVAMSTAFNLPAYTPAAGFSAKVATVYNGAVNALYRGHGYVTIGLRDNVAPTNCEANNSSIPKESNCWIWQDNTAMVYKNWEVNQPDNHLGQEHYVHVLNDGTWNDNSGNFLSQYALQLTPNTGTQLYYADVDGDGYGRPNSQIRACTAPTGYVLNNLDCYDSNAPITPPSVSSITASGASATWTTITGGTYSLQYKPTSGTVWTTVNNLATAAYNFTGLSANTEYQVQVKELCTYGAASDWSVVKTFTTFPSQTISISSPISGTFTAGQNVTVTYASTNGTANVNLELVTCTGTVALATIATGVTSTGSLVYVLPSTLAAGSYRIKAFVAGTTIFYYGTCFTVNVPQTIAISSPISGTFTAGQDVTLTYASTNGTANVTLELVTCTGTTALLSIADGVAASGTRTYSLPSSLAAGSYRIRAYVTGTTGQVYYGACFNVLGCSDLVFTNLQVTALSPYIQYSYTIKNIGTVPANLSAAILQAYVSSDIIFGNTGDIGAGGRYLSGSLASNAVIDGNFSGGVVNTNTHPYLVIKVDINNGIVECNESNNTFYTPIPIQTIAISSPISGTFTAGQDVTVTYVSTNWTANVNLELVSCTGTTALAVIADGVAASGTRTYTLPTTLAAGSYRIKSYVTGTTGQAYYGACFTVTQSLNLVAQYPFNGNANDESGKGNHGIVQGGAILTTDRFGVANKAYNFAGYSNRSAIRVPNSTTLQFTNTLSISFWYYMNTYQGMDGNGALSNYGLHSLITKDGDRGGFYSAISGDLANNNTNFGFANGASFGNYTGVDKAFPNMSNNLTLWTHISVVISTQDMKIFKNGVLAVTKALTTPMVFTASNTKDLYFGTFFGVGSWFPLNAKLDDISIHNKALTDAEVSILYNSEKPPVASTSITSPISGTFTAGQNVTVTYTSTNVVGNLSFELVSCTGTTPIAVIVNDVAATGSRTYTLPSNLPTGSYRIKTYVTGTIGQGVYGTCFTVNNAVLPIELVNFNGTNEGAINKLTWTTANEINNKAFGIERSEEGKTFFNISQIPAANKPNTYQFYDYQPFPTTYYRLRQIDMDGTERLSNIVSVSMNGKDKLKVYPSPVFDILIVETEEKGDFKILNTLGQQVLSGKVAPTVDVSSLPQGTYVFVVGLKQVKFIKM
jgi:Concanavalin A-like lectin/glucanases superfamily/PKD domain/Putative metal-binding motif/CARDB/Fibronectin type III domain